MNNTEQIEILNEFFKDHKYASIINNQNCVSVRIKTGNDVIYIESNRAYFYCPRTGAYMDEVRNLKDQNELRSAIKEHLNRIKKITKEYISFSYNI